MTTIVFPPVEPPPTVGGWRYSVVATVDSTNRAVTSQPAWTALRAETQTAGRGRTPDRGWVSDVGGLWLSAVVPCPGSRSQWETLPLAAGWAVVNAVRERGVTGARLRWPNDVLVGTAKLAGLLVERHAAETAVVGIGLNVFNRPDAVDHLLAGHCAVLSQYVRGEYTLDQLATEILDSLRQAHGLLAAGRFAAIAGELNESWGGLRHVEITFRRGERPIIGSFHGVDQHGRLRVTTSEHGLRVYDAAQIELFRELSS